MADRSGSRAPRRLHDLFVGPRRKIPADRRQRRPSVEFLEGRTLLAGSNTPTSPVPIHLEPTGTPTPQQLGAAYHQVEAIQAHTILQLSAAHRRLYAAFDQLAARANAAVARDRRILQRGADITSSTEQGLVVARGIEDTTTTTDKIYIPQHLFITLDTLLQQAQTTSSNIVRSARRGTDSAIHKLDTLDAGLADPGGPRR